MLDGNPAGQSHGNQAQKPQQQRPAQQAGGYQSNSQRPAAQQQPPMDFSDDIPFAPIGLSNKRLLHCI